jgi:uncharacterized membrane protein
MAATMIVLEHVALSVGLVGLAILLWGVARGAVRLVRLELRGRPFEDDRSERAALRGLVGYYLLLGLEFLVAADVIETILTPSLERVLILGGVVLIRTIISFSLNWELERGGAEAAVAPGPASATVPAD